jgi:hypothetical protein
MNDTPIRIYHNALLEEPRRLPVDCRKGRRVEIIDYLATPPSRDELRDAAAQTRHEPADSCAAAKRFQGKLRRALAERRRVAGRPARAPDPDRTPDRRARRPGGARRPPEKVLELL